MQQAAIKLIVWTEGLDPHWGQDAELKERLERGPMSLSAVVEEIEKIKNFYEEEANALFVLERGKRQLHVTLVNGKVEISDPGDPNYQNISLSDSGLESFLGDHFMHETVEETVQAHRFRLAKLITVTTAIAALLVAAILLNTYVAYDSTFIPEPEVAKIDNPAQASIHLDEYAGVYATNVGDGEMVFEINLDGTWKFYDMFHSTKGFYSLQEVVGGKWQPVYEKGRLALMTDNRYLLYPEKNNALVFLDRNFERIATNRNDLPYLKFPGAPRPVAWSGK